MKRAPVDSSSISSIGYDGGTAVLEIEYRNGNVYRYFAVPASIYAALVASESMGTFVNTVIKPRYPCERR
jgi:hypothetical protein